MPTIQCDDPVGADLHRKNGHGGIDSARRQVRVLSDEAGYANPVVRIRGDDREFRKPCQEAGFHVRAVVLSKKVGHFGHAQHRDYNVRAAALQSLDARRMIRVRNVD